MYEAWKGRWKVLSRGGSDRPPLLLLHGFTGDGESWSDVVARLGPGRTVVTLTLPGHEPPARRSALSMREPDFETIVDRLAGDLSHILPPPYHIVGYSMGARVALGLLTRHKEFFSKAMLIGGHPGLESPLERKKRAAADVKWADRIIAGGVEAFVEAWEEQPLFSTQAELPAGARTAQRRVRESHTAEGLAWAMRYLGLGVQPSFWDALGDVEVPVDVVAGALDEKFVKIAERMVKAIPTARIYRVPDVGHNVVLERPDVIADLIAERTPSCRFVGARSSATRTSATKKPKASPRSRSTARR